jgi:hypothetical protein
MEKIKNVLVNKHHWKSYFDHEYIGGFSLTDMDAIVTIVRYVQENVVNPKTKTEGVKFVLYIQDSQGEHKMIVNSTNAGNIEKALGTPDPDKWAGRKIQLYSERGKWFGKESDALRVRDVAPKVEVDVTADLKALSKVKTLAELQEVYKALPNWADSKVTALKDELKTKLA